MDQKIELTITNLEGIPKNYLFTENYLEFLISLIYSGEKKKIC